MDDGYKRLASAVIVLAVRDYRRKKSNGSCSVWDETFFRSEWCSTLIQIAGFDVTGTQLLKMIKET